MRITRNLAALAAVPATLALISCATVGVITTVPTDVFTKVKNTDQTSQASGTEGWIGWFGQSTYPHTREQSFTTGSDSRGYVLRSVIFKVRSTTGTASLTADLYQGDTRVQSLWPVGCWNHYSQIVCKLGKDPGQTTWTLLSANTTYTLKLTGSNIQLDTTTSDSEDSGKETGWSISNDSTSTLTKSGTQTETTHQYALQMAVQAEVFRRESTPGAVRNLTATVVDHESVRLDWDKPTGSHPAHTWMSDITHYEYRVWSVPSPGVTAQVRDWTIVPCNLKLEPGSSSNYITDSTPTTCTIDGLSADTTYRIRLKAMNKRGTLKHGTSLAVDVTTPAAPSLPQLEGSPTPNDAKHQTTPPLTGNFSQYYKSHTGEWFYAKYTFSETPHGLSWRTVRDDLFVVTGGHIMNVRRSPGSSTEWDVWFKPDSHTQDVIIEYADNLPACGLPGAVCTRDGRALENGPRLSISARTAITPTPVPTTTPTPVPTPSPTPSEPPLTGQFGSAVLDGSRIRVTFTFSEEPHISYVTVQKTSSWCRAARWSGLSASSRARTAGGSSGSSGMASPTSLCSMRATLGVPPTSWAVVATTALPRNLPVRTGQKSELPRPRIPQTPNGGSTWRLTC